MVNKFSASIQRGFESTEQELEANAALISAAPAMAEALLELVAACDTAPPVDLLQHIATAYKSARSALLSAGYTEAADQE
jgi:hypothetical protein